jgi:hypothetical protein
VNEGGDSTIVVVRDGQGEATGEGQAYNIHPHEIGTFNGTDQLNADIQNWGDDEDDFDSWCADRDRHYEHSTSARYVSTDVIGYEDLDDYGGWRPVPEYGTVWFPHVTVVGWAPYHYGHWAYIAPWGYTWVDDAPWGFAPFHYGRWVAVGGVWGWVPCPPRPAVVTVAYVRPVYAPALVAWVGGPHFAVGVGVGGGGGFAAGVSVGWFPLGPREVYVPSYHVSRTYVNNVNVSNTTVNTTVVNNYYNTTVVNKNTTINNTTVNNNVMVNNNQHYMNQGVPGAVTATTPQAFTSAQPVAKNMVQVNQKEVASAPVAYNAPAVAPAKQAVLGTGRPSAVRPPAVMQTRPVVAKVTPPPPPPAFEKQQQAIQQNGGRPIAISQERQLAPATTAKNVAPVKIAPPAKPAAQQNAPANGNGNNKFGGGQPQPNVENRPVNQPPNNANRPPNVSQPQNNAANKPANVQPNQPANSGNQPGNGNGKNYGDRPPASRPANINNVNPQLEQKHQQQLDTLHQEQDQERQKLEQKQQQEQQKLAQKNADDARQAQLNQKHQQQLDQLEQKHDQQQQKLVQKQTQEHQKSDNHPPSKPPKEDRPHGK